jgi:hypothetical protein
MANRAYLAVTDNDTIYPSAAESDYSPDDQTVAQAPYCVPILWLALFRPADIRSTSFDIDGETILGTAPVAPVETALRQLRSAMPQLRKMFETQGSFDGYPEMLSEAIASTRRGYVTIELEEIACMSDPEQFYEDVEVALAAIDGSESVETGREKLIAISEIPKEAKFPSPRCIVDASPASDEEMDAHFRILGAKYIRNVPWE